MSGGRNMLVLDEPRHLVRCSRAARERAQALRTLMFFSADRYFIDKLAQRLARRQGSSKRDGNELLQRRTTPVASPKSSNSTTEEWPVAVRTGPRLSAGGNSRPVASESGPSLGTGREGPATGRAEVSPQRRAQQTIITGCVAYADRALGADEAMELIQAQREGRADRAERELLGHAHREAHEDRRANRCTGVGHGQQRHHAEP